MRSMRALPRRWRGETMTPEGRVKAAIKKWLEGQGVIAAAHVHNALAAGTEFTGWYYMPVASMYSVKGIPDFIGVWHGVGWGIEAKAPDGEPTDNQLDQLRAIEQAGGVTAVVSSVSQLAAFKARLEDVWKNAHSKSPKTSSVCSKPTQSGASAPRPLPSTSPGSMASTAWIAAPRSAKVVFALAGAGALNARS